MLGIPAAASIRSVMSGPAVVRTFAFALVGRLAYGLLPLCLLFTIRDASGSLATAASTSAAFAFAAMAMPVQARLVDRFGQRRVLPCYASCFASLLITVGVLSRADQSNGAWIGLGVLLGLSAPALGPAMRAQWREIAPEGPPRRVAYSVDSVAEESLYLIGPLAASLVLATGPARVGLFLTAALVVVGTIALVASPYVPTAGIAPVPDHQASTAGVLRRRGFPGLLSAMALFGAAGAACLFGVAGLADHAGKPSVVGIIEAAMAVGAILAGLTWARLRREVTWSTALTALLLVAALAALGQAVAAPSLGLVGAFLVLSGAAAAPIFVVAFMAADALVAPPQRTEASTWVSTSFNGGNAAGTALAGFAVAVGHAAPFVLASGLALSATLIVLHRRHRDRTTSTPSM